MRNHIKLRFEVRKKINKEKNERITIIIKVHDRLFGIEITSHSSFFLG